jgi:hypothetical protein
MKLRRFAMISPGVGAVVIGTFWVVGSRKPTLKHSEVVASYSPNSVSNLTGMLALSPSELERMDIARMNLLCAQDLPGAERLAIGGSLITIDQMAARVRSETDRHRYRYQRNASHLGSRRILPGV